MNFFPFPFPFFFFSFFLHSVFFNSRKRANGSWTNGKKKNTFQLAREEQTPPKSNGILFFSFAKWLTFCLVLRFPSEQATRKKKLGRKKRKVNRHRFVIALQKLGAKRGEPIFVKNASLVGSFFFVSFFFSGGHSVFGVNCVSVAHFVEKGKGAKKRKKNCGKKKIA